MPRMSLYAIRRGRGGVRLAPVSSASDAVELLTVPALLITFTRQPATSASRPEARSPPPGLQVGSPDTDHQGPRQLDARSCPHRNGARRHQRWRPHSHGPIQPRSRDIPGRASRAGRLTDNETTLRQLLARRPSGSCRPRRTLVRLSCLIRRWADHRIDVTIAADHCCR